MIKKGSTRWITETMDTLNKIVGIVTVTYEDSSKLGFRAGMPCFILFDEHNNAWRFGPGWGAIPCPFITAVNKAHANHKNVEPDPTILMTLISLYYELIYTPENRWAHKELVRVIGHQTRRYRQRIEIQEKEGLPGCPAKEYARRFKAIEQIKEDCRIGLFAGLGNKPIAEYILKKYKLPYTLLKGLADALIFSVKPDLFWPTAQDIEEYVQARVKSTPQAASHESPYGPRSGSNWTGD